MNKKNCKIKMNCKNKRNKRNDQIKMSHMTKEKKRSWKLKGTTGIIEKNKRNTKKKRN